MSTAVLSSRLLPATAVLLAPYLVMGCWLGRHYSESAVVSYALVVLAMLLLLGALSRTWKKLLLWHLPLALAGAILAGYAIISGDLPGDPIAYVLVTSSPEEVMGFFSLPQQQRLLALLVASLALYGWLALRLPPRPVFPVLSARVRWLAISAFAIMAAYAARVPNEFISGIAASPLVGSVMFATGPLAAANAQVHGNLQQKTPYDAQRVDATEVHILIVGESSRRDSWSAYGYARPTTPFMSKLKDEAVFLARAATDANATVRAVPMLLTGLGPEHYVPTAIRGNLFDLAKEAGYYTSWLVNQDASVSHLVGMDADEAVYPHSTSETAMRNLPPDGRLLAALQRQLARAGKPLLIGLHVDGSHWAYFNRYPAAFERFGSGQGLTFASLLTAGADDRVLDSYDNSILYTDWFLEQVIEQARQLKVPATVTYLADHGESLYVLDGRAGHGTNSDFVAAEFDIPAFVWANSAYRQAHPDRVRTLASNASKAIRTHDFFYALADLMGIRWPGALPQRSFVSSAFKPDTSSRYSAGGKLVARTD